MTVEQLGRVFSRVSPWPPTFEDFSIEDGVDEEAWRILCTCSVLYVVGGDVWKLLSLLQQHPEVRQTLRRRVWDGSCLYIGGSAGTVLAGHHSGYCVDFDPTPSCPYPPADKCLDLLGGAPICAYHEEHQPVPKIFQERQAAYPDELCVRMGPRIALLRSSGGDLHCEFLNPHKKGCNRQQLDFTIADLRRRGIDMQLMD